MLAHTDQGEGMPNICLSALRAYLDVVSIDALKNVEYVPEHSAFSLLTEGLWERHFRTESPRGVPRESRSRVRLDPAWSRRFNGEGRIDL